MLQGLGWEKLDLVIKRVEHKVGTKDVELLIKITEWSVWVNVGNRSKYVSYNILICTS